MINNKFCIFQNENGSKTLDVVIHDQTLWLSLNQVAELFQRDKSVISRHLKNIFAEEELDRESVVAFFTTTASDGKSYQVEYFNLDTIISVGYRVNSNQGIAFRKWATKTLHTYLIDGYMINNNVKNIFYN